MKGPAFIALHKLFDEINEDVEEYVDLIAERVVQLGGIAEGTVRIVAKRSSLDRLSAGPLDAARSTWPPCRTRWPCSAGPPGSGSRR